MTAYRNTMKVRYSDADVQGHLYFANYLVFADEVVCDYWRELDFSFDDVDKLPCLIFTVNASIDWLSECGVNDLIDVSVGFSRLGNSSADTTFELLNTRTGEVSARGTFTHVFVDKSTRKSCPIPGVLREKIVARQPELAD